MMLEWGYHYVRGISWGIFWTYFSGLNMPGLEIPTMEVLLVNHAELPEGASRWPFSKTLSWLSKLGEYYDKYGYGSIPIPFLGG